MQARHHLLHLALEERFGEILVVLQIAERHLGLDHVELGEVARRVRVLGAEGRAEGVDVGEGQREDLGFELSADREVGALAEEVLREIGAALPRSSVVTWNIWPAPSASDAEITGACT